APLVLLLRLLPGAHLRQQLRDGQAVLVVLGAAAAAGPAGRFGLRGPVVAGLVHSGLVRAGLMIPGLVGRRGDRPETGGGGAPGPVRAVAAALALVVADAREDRGRPALG